MPLGGNAVPWWSLLRTRRHGQLAVNDAEVVQCRRDRPHVTQRRPTLAYVSFEKFSRQILEAAGVTVQEQDRERLYVAVVAPADGESPTAERSADLRFDL